MAREIRITMNMSEESHIRIAKAVEDVLFRALDALKKRGVAVEVFIMNPKEIKAVNKATRGINKPTNVLSFEAEGFPYAEDRDVKYLGEIYLAPEVAKERKQSVKFLAIHGLLHLLGYTHEEKRDTITMERAEDRLLEKLSRKK